MIDCKNKKEKFGQEYIQTWSKILKLSRKCVPKQYILQISKKKKIVSCRSIVTKQITNKKNKQHHYPCTQHDVNFQQITDLYPINIIPNILVYLRIINIIQKK